MTPQLITEIGNVGALQIRQGDHHQLLASGGFMGLKLLGQLLTHRRLDHLGVVHHPPGQRRENQLGTSCERNDPQQQHQARFQCSHW
ncbi:hypothetical protein D3C72_2327670 [compost metagenome]